jgi:hypothetical protein
MAMVAKPTITISQVEELFTDDLGQFWSPARVTLVWPPASNRLRSPMVTIEVIAAAAADMTLEQLAESHLQAAHDVLNAALLSLEQPPPFHSSNHIAKTR